MSHSEMVEKNKKYTLSSWKSQLNWNPIAIEKAEGVYFWDVEGKRFLDWSSQLINVNIGHGNKHVNQAIQDQLSKFCYCSPSIATEARARLGEMLREITPIEDCKAFFTNGGAEAVENAMKIARLYTGRQKIITRYRSYHGGTFGTMSAGGDPRRLANEPGVPWIVRIHGPYSYRNPVYKGRTQEEGDIILADGRVLIIKKFDPNDYIKNEDINSHTAWLCGCGCCRLNLLSSGKIKCEECGKIQEGEHNLN